MRAAARQRVNGGVLQVAQQRGPHQRVSARPRACLPAAVVPPRIHCAPPRDSKRRTAAAKHAHYHITLAVIVVHPYCATAAPAPAGGIGIIAASGGCINQRRGINVSARVATPATGGAREGAKGGTAVGSCRKQHRGIACSVSIPNIGNDARGGVRRPAGARHAGNRATRADGRGVRTPHTNRLRGHAGRHAVPTIHRHAVVAAVAAVAAARRRALQPNCHHGRRRAACAASGRTGMRARRRQRTWRDGRHAVRELKAARVTAGAPEER